MTKGTPVAMLQIHFVLAASFSEDLVMSFAYIEHFSNLCSD